MSFLNQSKSYIEHLLLWTPIIISSVAVWFAYRQAQTSKEKLRLDLYNRRFGISEKSLSFYLLLERFDGVDTEKSISEFRGFIQAKQESKFLFDPDSNVYKILNELHEDGHKIRGFRQNGKDLLKADPTEFIKWSNEVQTTQLALPSKIEALEKAMAPYLDFHKIGS